MNLDETKEKLIKELDKNKKLEAFTIPIVIAIFLVALLVGTGSGYLLAKKEGPATTSDTRTTETSKEASGILDKKKFPDDAEGTLKKGGIDGEGNFHLERPGGESQNVYLTSSTVDLTKFIGKKVRVWGQTFTGQKAGWLMDVGYLEVL
ncbi:MAG: hypothetical protein WEC80_02185 [Patescibacteria group bacterium]